MPIKRTHNDAKVDIAHGGLQTRLSEMRMGPMRVLMCRDRCKKRRETASNRDPESVCTGKLHSLEGRTQARK
jgi:hypothetical protein